MVRGVLGVLLVTVVAGAASADGKGSGGTDKFGTKAECTGWGTCLPNGRSSGNFVFSGSGAGGCVFTARIDWADGQSNTYTTRGNLAVSHQYSAPGRYAQKITGSAAGEGCSFSGATIRVEVPRPKPAPKATPTPSRRPSVAPSPDGSEAAPGGGLSPAELAAILALAAAGLAGLFTPLVVKAHKKATAEQQKQIEDAVAERAAKDRTEQQAVEDLARQRAETERLRLDQIRAERMSTPIEDIVKEHAPAPDTRIEVPIEFVQDVTKKVLRVGPIVDFPGHLGENVSEVTDSYEEVDAWIAARAAQLVAEGKPEVVARTLAADEYNRGSGARSAQALRDSGLAVGDAAVDTAKESAEGKATKSLLKWLLKR